MHPLQIRRQFVVSNEEVFDAWTKPEIMIRWLFKTTDNEVLRINIDLRESGKYSIIESTNAVEIELCGFFFEVIRPSRLRFSLRDLKHLREPVM